MKPECKAFYFLIDMEEWDFAYEIGQRLDIDKTHFNLLKVILNIPLKRYIRRDRSITSDCPIWIFDITPYSIFEYEVFIIDNSISDYYSCKLVKIAMERVFERKFKNRLPSR